MNSKLLNVNQAAEALNTSRSSIYRLIGSCEIDGLKVRGSLRITSESIESYIRREISKFQENNGVRTV
jgi:excisionase family DNA binding protein